MKGRHESSEPVRAKKHLGQHFLKDQQIASKIADTLSLEGYEHVLEIGPGTGVLTQFLIKKPITLQVIDLDRESIEYLRTTFVEEHQPKTLTITEGDFLKKDLAEFFDGDPFAITGNFPYNISTQIVFKMLEYRDRIPEFTGMFQKEVAQRICENQEPRPMAYSVFSFKPFMMPPMPLQCIRKFSNLLRRFNLESSYSNARRIKTSIVRSPYFSE